MTAFETPALTLKEKGLTKVPPAWEKTGSGVKPAPTVALGSPGVGVV